MSAALPYLILYVVGVGVGLAVMSDSWPTRLAVALVWPLGPIAFAVVTTILVLAAVVLWPLPALAAGALLGATAWWLMS